MRYPKAFEYEIEEMKLSSLQNHGINFNNQKLSFLHKRKRRRPIEMLTNFTIQSINIRNSLTP